jgi:hypothetical protein
MAKNKYENFKGTAMWAQVFEGNRDRADWTADTDGQYKISLILSDEEFDRLKATGSQAADYAKTTDDGQKMVTFKRPHAKHDRSGKLMDWASGAPKVFHSDGTLWKDEDGLIGNGSEVEVRVCIYNAGRVGTRLEGVKVERHVEVTSEDSGMFQFS